MQIGLQRQRLADIACIAPVGQKLRQILRPTRGMHDRQPAALRGLAQHVVAAAQVVRARVVEEVGVVDKSGHALPREALHLAHELHDLLRRLRHRAEHVHNVPHLKLLRLQRGKIAVIPPERHRARRVAADVEHDEIPVLREGRGHRGGHVARRQPLSGEGRGHDVYLVLLQQLDAVGHAEIVVDLVEVDDLRAFAARCGADRDIQRDLRFAGAVVADKDYVSALSHDCASRILLFILYSFFRRTQYPAR